MAKNKYYAIRKGAGVQNKIVTSWEECKWFVTGYPAVYKAFSNREDAEAYLGLSDAEVIRQQQQKKLAKRSHK